MGQNVSAPSASYYSSQVTRIETCLNEELTFYEALAALKYGNLKYKISQGRTNELALAALLKRLQYCGIAYEKDETTTGKYMLGIVKIFVKDDKGKLFAKLLQNSIITANNKETKMKYCYAFYNT